MKYFDRPLDHINLTVPNIESAVEFYTKVMGFEVKERYKDGMEFVFITDGKITYELIENSFAKSTVIDHIAYASEDIEKDFEHFKSLGLATTEVGFIDFLFEKGVYYFFIKGSANEKIEFCQRRR